MPVVVFKNATNLPVELGIYGASTSGTAGASATVLFSGIVSGASAYITLTSGSNFYCTAKAITTQNAVSGFSAPFNMLTPRITRSSNVTVIFDMEDGIQL